MRHERRAPASTITAESIIAMTRLQRIICICVIYSLLAGCDEGPPAGPIPVYPVDGRITIKGQALPNALIVFHPDPASGKEPTPPPRSVGKTDGDGRFRMHTYFADDGVPPGSYKITVAPAGSSENRDLMSRGGTTGLKVAIPRKYSDAARSELTATVKPGENPPLEIELK